MGNEANGRSGSLKEITPTKDVTKKMLTGFEMNISRAHNLLNSHLNQSAAAAASAELANPNCSRLMAPEQNLVRKLLYEEKDDRYRYLLRHGNLHHIEAETFSIYVELP